MVKDLERQIMFVHAPVGLHSLRTMVPSVWGLEIVLHRIALSIPGLPLILTE
jgi:hypothetical protein